MNQKKKVAPAEKFETGALSRYFLSESEKRQFRQDYIRFEEDYPVSFPNRFISQILVNYLTTRSEAERIQFKQDVFNQFQQKKRTNEKHSDSDLRFTLTKPFTDLVQKTFLLCEHPDFRKSVLISFILEQFASLPLSKREAIYFHSAVKEIHDALRDHCVLQMTATTRRNPDEVYEVRPIDLKEDENTGSYYLIGYSRQWGSEENFSLYTTKLSRIRDCYKKEKPCTITIEEYENAQMMCSQYGTAFVMEKNFIRENENAVIRLSRDGYQKKYLKQHTEQRPIPCKEPLSIDEGKYYELEFDCSHQQIFNYFFPFGDEAEILSPKSLRDGFMRKYMKALKNYAPDR